MGNLLVADMGHLIMRMAIADRNNILHDLLVKYDITQQWNATLQSFPYDLSHGFNLAMTVHVEHTTIYFLRYHILDSDAFFKSTHFKALYSFLELNFQKEKGTRNDNDISKSVFNDFPYEAIYSHKLEFKSPTLQGIISKIDITAENYYLNSTGGYNDHYLKYLSEVLKIPIKKNHMFSDMIVTALDYLNYHTGECFFKAEKETESKNCLTEVHKSIQATPIAPVFYSVKSLYPYILVVIRSGMTIHRVNSVNKIAKIGSSAIGGSTFVGLMRMLTKFTDPEQAIHQSISGNNMKIDLSVGDIYGYGIEISGLKSEVIASSFAKASKLSSEERKKLEDKDVCMSICSMVMINMIQIAYLYAKLEGISEIVIVGTKFMSIELAQRIEVEE